MSEDNKPLEQAFFQGEVLARLKNIESLVASKTSADALIDARVRVLEQWRYWVIGAATIAGGASSVIMKLLLK